MIRKRDPPLVDRSYSEEDADMQMRDLEAKRSRSVDSPVVLSDDKNENKISAADLILSGADSRLSHENNIPPSAHDGASLFVPRKMISPTHGTSSSFAEPVQKAYVSDGVDLTSRPGDSDAKRGIVGSFLRKLETIGEKRVLESKSSNKECVRSLDKVSQKKSSGETNKTSYSDTVCMDSEPNGSILKELVRDAEDDPLEFAFSSAQQTLTKAVPSDPKRRVIQLNVPLENRSGYSQKFEVGVRRFKPPRLEEWFRAILELDYFATVGLASPGEDENRTSAELQQVPVCFESPEQYVDIFRPLVLEEFKAQLCSAFQEISSIEDMSCGSLSVVSVERVDDFHLVRCIPDERDSSLANNCMENDLLLLTKQPLQNSGHHVHMIGKLEKRKKNNKKRLNILVVRLYFRSGCARHNRARKLLLERSKWFVGRITSIIPQLREFHALSSIKSIPALPVILNSAYHRTYGKHRNADLGKLPPAMHQALESRYNASQFQAISASIQPSTSPSEFQLSLIQGPPDQRRFNGEGVRETLHRLP